MLSFVIRYLKLKRFFLVARNPWSRVPSAWPLALVCSIQLGEGGIVAEERNAAGLELRTLLLESELESMVGGSEMLYSHRRRQRRAKRDAFVRCAPRIYP